MAVERMSLVGRKEGQRRGSGGARGTARHLGGQGEATSREMEACLEEEEDQALPADWQGPSGHAHTLDLPPAASYLARAACSSSSFLASCILSSAICACSSAICSCKSLASPSSFLLSFSSSCRLFSSFFSRTAKKPGPFRGRHYPRNPWRTSLPARALHTHTHTHTHTQRTHPTRTTLLWKECQPWCQAPSRMNVCVP